jgi:hypothetical protein
VNKPVLVTVRDRGKHGKVMGRRFYGIVERLQTLKDR